MIADFMDRAYARNRRANRFDIDTVVAVVCIACAVVALIASL